MKFATLLLLSLVSASAFAEVKPRGAFVPSLCSFNENRDEIVIDIVAVESVCLGELNGMNQQAIEVNVNDGTSKIFAIDMKKPVIRMGATTTSFKGVNINDEEETIKGRYWFTSGITVTHKIEIETSTNLEFTDDLEMVFTTL